MATIQIFLNGVQVLEGQTEVETYDYDEVEVIVHSKKDNKEFIVQFPVNNDLFIKQTLKLK